MVTTVNSSARESKPQKKRKRYKKASSSRKKKSQVKAPIGEQLGLDAEQAITNEDHIKTETSEENTISEQGGEHTNTGAVVYLTQSLRPLPGESSLATARVEGDSSTEDFLLKATRPPAASGFLMLFYS